jgi:primary-amine oxidase
MYKWIPVEQNLQISIPGIQSTSFMSSTTIYPRVHPLIGLSSVEIRGAALVLSKSIQDEDNSVTKAFRFRHITLFEPPKALLLPYLDAESAGVAVEQRPFVPRCAQISFTEPDGSHLREACISLDTETVVSTLAAKKGSHAHLDRYTSLTSFWYDS